MNEDALREFVGAITNKCRICGFRALACDDGLCLRCRVATTGDVEGSFDKCKVTPQGKPCTPRLRRESRRKRRGITPLLSIKRSRGRSEQGY